MKRMKWVDRMVMDGGDHFVVYIDCELQCFTLVTYIILYTNLTL